MRNWVSVHVNMAADSVSSTLSSQFSKGLSVRIVHTPQYSEVGVAVRPILTCSAVPVTCEHIDCYFCTCGLVMYAFQNTLRDDLIRLHAFLLQYSSINANTKTV